MNKRIRKKQLKKLNAWVNPKDTWSLDITFAKFAIPRLKLFKKSTIGFPWRLKSFEEWEAILDKMILAFELIANGDDDFTREDYEEINKKINEGLELFATYFRDLWW